MAAGGSILAGRVTGGVGRGSRAVHGAFMSCGPGERHGELAPRTADIVGAATKRHSCR